MPDRKISEFGPAVLQANDNFVIERNATPPNFRVSAAAVLTFVEAGIAVPAAQVVAGTFGAGNFEFPGTLAIQPTERFYLDGIGDTYIVESGANTIKVFTGGAEALDIDGAGNLTVAAQLVTTAGDATIYGLTMGLGGGSIATNTAIGVSALLNNTTGNSNVMVGYVAAVTNTQGSSNVAVGRAALFSNVTSNNNVAVGRNCLLSAVGSGNVGLGYFAGGYEVGSNAFYVDNQDRVNTAGDKAGAILYGVFNATPANQVLTVNAKLVVSEALVVQAANRIYLDGEGTTYFLESADGVVSFFNDGAEALRIEDPADLGAQESSLWLYDLDNAALIQVTFGAPNSGGAGLKALVVPN
jgi:hypothetical protein